jgi:hypothetical protein
VKPTKELLDAIYRERVLRARRMPLEKKFLAGADLFEQACRIAMDGIRDQYGDLGDQRVQELLRQRVALLERLGQTQ